MDDEAIERLLKKKAYLTALLEEIRFYDGALVDRAVMSLWKKEGRKEVVDGTEE